MGSKCACEFHQSEYQVLLKELFKFNFGFQNKIKIDYTILDIKIFKNKMSSVTLFGGFNPLCIYKSINRRFSFLHYFKTTTAKIFLVATVLRDGSTTFCHRNK